MAYDGLMYFDNVELFNVSRLTRLSRVIGANVVRINRESTAWIEEQITGGFGSGGFGVLGFGLGPFGGSVYETISDTPWYDAGYAASSEFAGLVPLSVQGLDDSSLISTPIEYITDGGNAGKARNATQTIVFNVAIIASTERGAEFGKRWLDHLLRGSAGPGFCTGSTLRYLRYGALGAPEVHRNNVRLTRGSSVTRKKRGTCATIWYVTFTLTAADPYEYGVPVPAITSLGGASATGPKVTGFGSLTLVETGCPVYDYSPVYDPIYPALVASPTAPDFLPAGWGIDVGMNFKRSWATISSTEPSGLVVAPLIKVSASTEARMVRISVWPSGTATNDQCQPLFGVVIFYLPTTAAFYIDAEQKVSYLWDGLASSVRRTDSLVYSPQAGPLEWAAFETEGSLLVTLDVFETAPGVYQGADSVRAELLLVPKSD